MGEKWNSAPDPRIPKTLENPGIPGTPETFSNLRDYLESPETLGTPKISLDHRDVMREKNFSRIIIRFLYSETTIFQLQKYLISKSSVLGQQFVRNSQFLIKINKNIT